MKELKDLNLKEISKIRDMKKDDLLKELNEGKRKFFVLQMKLQANELKQTHLIKALRRYIAKLSTILKEKTLQS